MNSKSPTGGDNRSRCYSNDLQGSDTQAPETERGRTSDTDNAIGQSISAPDSCEDSVEYEVRSSQNSKAVDNVAHTNSSTIAHPVTKAYQAVNEASSAGGQSIETCSKQNEETLSSSELENGFTNLAIDDKSDATYCDKKAESPSVVSDNNSENDGEQKYRNGEKVLFIYCLCSKPMHVTMTELLDHLVDYHNAHREHVKKFVKIMLRKQRYSRIPIGSKPS